MAIQYGDLVLDEEAEAGRTHGSLQTRMADLDVGGAAEADDSFFEFAS